VHIPAVVTEFLVPLTIEAPTTAWTRVLHADRNRCWITSRYEVFRCDRSERNSVRIEPDPYPVRLLEEDGQVVPVEDAALAARISARTSRPDTAESEDGTRWVAAGDLVALHPDGTGERIDLETRTAGTVEWIRSDPMTDPKNADGITVLTCRSWSPVRPKGFSAT